MAKISTSVSLILDCDEYGQVCVFFINKNLFVEGTKCIAYIHQYFASVNYILLNNWQPITLSANIVCISLINCVNMC